MQRHLLAPGQIRAYRVRRSARASEELGCPRPGVLEVKLAAAARECEPAGDVQQPVAQPLRPGLGELPVEDERLGPDEQVVHERDDL
jgi:hypothetical protein